MSKLLFSTILAFFLFGCENKEDYAKSENSATLAVKKEAEFWTNRHQVILSKLNPGAELILIGDSIFNKLDNEDHKEVWPIYLDAYKTINMGVSSDKTENVIWRLENGSLENINPKLALVLIGTNNTNPPEEIAGGIKKICAILNKKKPNTKILLIGILPYGSKLIHKDNIHKATNNIISEFPKDNHLVHYIDIGDIYYNSQGVVRQDLMEDYFHPNTDGYMLMFKALDDKIKQLMIN